MPVTETSYQMLEVSKYRLAITLRSLEACGCSINLQINFRWAATSQIALFQYPMVCFIRSLKKSVPRILLHGSRDRVISVGTSFNCGKGDRGLGNKGTAIFSANDQTLST